MNPDNKAGIGIYIHIPFCIRKCLYCDFVSSPGSPDSVRKYMEALVREIRLCGEAGTEADTIFIGGGTPSIVPPALLDKVLEEIYKVFKVSPVAEITMEANPGTLSHEKLYAYRKMGISRLSIGLQSADNDELKSLGRIHTFEDFLISWEEARKAGFDNINIDLMTAVPGQTRESLLRTLKTAAELSPEHISAYSLIVEEGTPFSEMKLSLPDEETEYLMYDDTTDFLESHGFRQYEISNFAVPGKECIHNIAYWTRKDYLGFGISAASLRKDERYRIKTDMELYQSEWTDRNALITDREYLEPADRMEEFMFLGLRMTEGVSRDRFKKLFGHEMDEIYGDVIEKHRGYGLLDEAEGRIFLTRHGIHVSNQVMADFLL
ncbi:MAG: oxygen-independent coproporphyrinogen III oxidase [Blautia sp.]|nr:oxygen-independent coproporphyrinogen III oxidase [Blautia sp.]